MKTFFPFIVALAVMPLPALAQDNGLPTIRTLACDTDMACANSTPATTTDNGAPPYPREAERTAVEAFVQVSYTIGTDGVVKDVTLLHLVGPKEFASAAIAFQKKRKYTPATLNGQPVEQARTLEVTFDLNGYPGGRPSAAHAYNYALDQAKNKNFDDASILLSRELADPDLNFFERGMMENVVALIAISKQDFLGAREAVELPTEHYSSKVSPEVLKSMIRYRIVADLGLNDIDDAVRTVEIYKQAKGFDPADPLLKLVEDARVKADSLPEIATTQRIAAASESGGQYFILNRRTFSFSTVSGSLEKFSLNCRQQSIESQITASAEWHVPKNWDRCYLVVKGEPGTVYKINQFLN